MKDDVKQECTQCAPANVTQSPREIAERLAREMQCNCDLDNWEPERSTGHSWVCRIHRAAGETYDSQSKSC